MNRILDKWQYIFKAHREPMFRERRYKLYIGIFKLKTFPSVGTELTSDNYDGFLLRIPLYRNNVLKKTRR